MQQLTNIANSIITFINVVLVPLVFAVAFVVFLFGVFQYFFAGAANEEKRKQGRQFVMYSIIGFSVMIVMWGLVNLIVHTIGVTDNTAPPIPTFGTPSSSSATSSILTDPEFQQTMNGIQNQAAQEGQTNTQTSQHSGLLYEDQ